MIVPILARPELLEQMLASIDYPIHTLIVVDNGGAWPGPFDKHPMVENGYLLRMPSNLGVAPSWNLGIKATPFAPWWMIANFDITFPAGSLAQFDRSDAAKSLVLSGGMPPWCCFTIGEAVIDRVGLFDEKFTPAYFEDQDMEVRCRHAGIPIVQSAIPVDHANSSTLKAGYAERNAETFTPNAEYFNAKMAAEDRSAGQWSLQRRRALSWD